MADYDFKEWLTIEEAAAWLSRRTGDEYTAEHVSRAIMKSFIQAHYWPTDDAELGVFTNMLRLGGDENACSLAEGGHFLADYLGPASHTYDGAVPLFAPQLFLENTRRNIAVPIGITVWDGQKIAGGCYRIGPSEEAVSLATGRYAILIHCMSLEEFAAGLPDLKKHTFPATWFGWVSAPGVEGVAGFAHCATFGGRSLALSIDQPPQPDQEPTGTDAVASKALAFAAHLIADLAERLDEAESLPGKRLGLKRAGKPNVNAIAQALAETARQLNYDGHGYGKRGFQEAIGKALKAMD